MKYLCLRAWETESRPLLNLFRLHTSLQAKSHPAFRRLSKSLKLYLLPYSFLQVKAHVGLPFEK